MKRTYQPKKRARKREHGFMARMATKGGRRVLARRRAKGRKRLTPDRRTGLEDVPVLPMIRRRADFEAIGRDGQPRARHRCWSSARCGPIGPRRGSGSRHPGRSAAPFSAIGFVAGCESWSEREWSGSVPDGTSSSSRGRQPARQATPSWGRRSTRSWIARTSEDEENRAGTDHRLPEADRLDAAELPILADLLGLHLPGHRATTAWCAARGWARSASVDATRSTRAATTRSARRERDRN